MSEPRVQPKEIRPHTKSKRLEIEWADGHISDLPFHLLREQAPALPDRQDANGVDISDFQPVGHYAIKVVFDTDETATFTWEGLRNLDPTDESAPEPEVDVSQLPEVDRDTLTRALRRVHDPEIPVNIYDLGLIYNLDIHPDHTVDIKMTLTTPGCPEAATFPAKVEQAVKAVPGVVDARVELVWEPPWTKDHMSEEAKLALGIW